MPLDPITRSIIRILRGAAADAEAEDADKNKLLSYWPKLFENFTYSPKEFYGLVEKNIDAREIPGLERQHILLHEGSVMSKQRLYLQMRRERLVFEICAASFGTGFFVSSRLFDRRKQAHWWDYVILFALVMFSGMILLTQFEPITTGIILIVLLSALWSAMRYASTDQGRWLDERLYVMPILGPIYEVLFHPDTYFRQDQNAMYREAVHLAVIDSVNEMTATKGIRPLTDVEARPTLRGLRER